MLRVKAGGFTSVALTPDGGRLVSAHVDGRLRLWDAADGRVLAEASSGVVVYGRWAGRLFLSADGRRLAVAGGRHFESASLFTLADGEPAFVPGWPPAGERLLLPVLVRNAAMAPDGSCLYAATPTEVFRCDPVTQRQDRVVADARVWGLAVAPACTFLALAQKNRVTWHSLADHATLPFGGLDHPSPVNVLAFSPDGTALAAATERTVHVWVVATGAAVEGPGPAAPRRSRGLRGRRADGAGGRQVARGRGLRRRDRGRADAAVVPGRRRVLPLRRRERDDGGVLRRPADGRRLGRGGVTRCAS